MDCCLTDFRFPPINKQSKIIEEKRCDDLVDKSYDTPSMASIYLKQVPNIKSETKLPPVSSRMDRLKKAGLIGCFDDTGVDSSNYKEIIYGSQDLNSNE